MKNYLLAILSISCFIACKSKTEKPAIKNTESVTKTATLEFQIKAKLGEGAFWDHKNERFFWVDIENKQLHIYSPNSKTNKTFDLPSRIGTVVPKNENEAVIALEDGIYSINLKTGELEVLAEIEKELTYNRFNDGKCDPKGRLWAGTMNFDGNSKTGSLYQIDSVGTVTMRLDSVMISNGIVWTKDHTTMYYIDTPLSTVFAFDYDNESGNISNKRAAIKVHDSIGFPDGMTIDEHDNLWIGLWNGNAVGHFNPTTGKLIEKIPVPAHNVTACAFGGKNLDTLYITTASVDMSPEEAEKYPQAGSIFKYAPGVKGVKSNCFSKED